ncbi:MAG: PAS domain S-box protein [Proteobacteria bacterium]|nr:PAS domain S-box protein [Pseudomonadota bacterium]
MAVKQEQRPPEQQLLPGENRLRLILDTALDAVISIDKNGLITEWNKQAEAIFGWPAEEVIGKLMSDILIPPAYRAQHWQSFRKFLEDGSSKILNKRVGVEALTRSGTIIPVEVTVTVQRNENCYFTSFIRDMRCEKKAREKILKYSKELERSNQELDDFCYIVSHDLKEALRGIQHFSQFLLEDCADRLDEDGKKKLRTISDLTQRLGELLDVLLQYSRLGRTELAIGETNLNDVVQNVVQLFCIKIQETEAEVKICQQLPTIVCDRIRIAEVFRNLIGNALKYTDKKGNKIDIGCINNHTRALGENVFFVRDQGIGIAPEHLEAIFKIFKRLHPKGAYGGGTGSGLAITKKIISQHGGQTWAESKGKDQGTTFFFTLPQQKSVLITTQ